MIQKKRPGEKVKLISVDELLGVPNGDATEELPIDQIHSFKDHPFRVIDDELMHDLVSSIRHNGILTPVVVRPDSKGGYEMISGHRRMHAAKIIGMETIPGIIKELDDDDATIVMIDSNIQREELLPSEKAFAYKMKYDAMKRKAGRPTRQSSAKNRFERQNNSSQFERNLETAEIIGLQVGESRAQIHRFIRLTELIPELLSLVDSKKLPVVVAVEISYIDKDTQKYISEYIHENGIVKSYQIAELRKYLNEHDSITQNKMIRILNESLPGFKYTKKLTITESTLRTFFSDNYTISDMEKIILRLLKEWKAEQGVNYDEV